MYFYILYLFCWQLKSSYVILRLLIFFSNSSMQVSISLGDHERLIYLFLLYILFNWYRQENLMKCIHCGLENPMQSKLCRKCGTFLGVPLKCSQCGSNNPGDSISCIVCGARLSFIKENPFHKLIFR